MLEHFEKIGEYFDPYKAAAYEEYIGKTKSKRKSLVYALKVDGELKYIGKTVRGANRPLTYTQNDVMVNQRDGIRNALSEGKKVEVFAMEVPKEKVEFKGTVFEVDISEDVEKKLITEHKPKWNTANTK
jgi:hypothetical protein